MPTIPCSECGGKGYRLHYSSSKWVTCPTCKGASGRWVGYPWAIRAAYGVWPCSTCNTTGMVANKAFLQPVITCSACQGSGHKVIDE